MRRRFRSLIEAPSHSARERLANIPGLCLGMRHALAAGYDRTSFRADLLAGVVVAVVALPLSMALAIAVGVEPQHGLYTAIIAGIVIALLGGSRHQISGPTATYIVILAPIVAKFGLGGLLTAGLMAGVFLVLMGLAGLGKLIQYIPYPVTTGLTAGIAWVMATLQIKDVFGLDIAKQPEGYLEKLAAYWGARGSLRPLELGVAAFTLALLLIVPRVTRRVPAPLVAIAVAAIVAASIHVLFPSFEVDTIGSRFRTTVGETTYAGIPSLPPLPRIPWGDTTVTYDYLRALAPAAFAIAMLGAIETLLSAVIADGMTGSKHDSNAELISLGIGNMVTPFFGGIAASGTLARTATNVRAGARSPIAAVVHSFVVLATILLLARLVAYVPMASLAALLLVVAWNMSEARHFTRMLKVSPTSDATVLLMCFFLTVFFDMVVAVGVGVVLAALLFMRRMAEFTHTRAVISRDASSPALGEDDLVMPKGVALYEIAGALFFGAAQNAISSLAVVSGDVRVLVIDLGRVPVIDVTGLVALESIATDLSRRGIRIIIAGPLPQPRRVFDDAHLEGAEIVQSRRAAIARATELAEEIPEAPRSRLSVLPPRSTRTPPPAPASQPPPP